MAREEDEYKDPFNDGGEHLRKEISGKWVGKDSDGYVYSDFNEIPQLAGSILCSSFRRGWVNDYYLHKDGVSSYFDETDIAQADGRISRKRSRHECGNDYPYNNNGVHSYFKGNDYIIEDDEGNRKILYNHNPYKNNLIVEDDEDNMKTLYNIDPYRTCGSKSQG